MSVTKYTTLGNAKLCRTHPISQKKLIFDNSALRTNLADINGGMRRRKDRPCFLCLWFRASLIYINNCPIRCNAKQSFYNYASLLYMFRVSTTPTIRSTQNCNYSLQYWSYFCAATSLQRAISHLEGGSCTKI